MGVPQAWELPEKIIARLGTKTAGRQRAIIEDGHLLLILHEPPGPVGSDRSGVFFWRSSSGEWKHSGRGNGIVCLREHLQKYRDLEDFIENMYEEATCAGDYFRALDHLVPLHRAARHQSEALQVAREAIQGDRDLIEMRDEAGAIDRGMELLYLDTKNALEFDMARTAEEQTRIGQSSARASHRLNILAALFFPLTAIASVFGMNLPLGLEDAPFWASIAVIFAGVALGGAMLTWVVGGRGPGEG